MTTTQFMTATAVTLALLLSSAFVAAGAARCEDGGGRAHHARWHGGHHGKGSMLGRIERMMERIDADETQREAIHAIIEVHRPALRELRDEFHGARAALKDILVQGVTDQAAIDALALAQADNAERMTREMAAMMADVGAVLSDEQRATLGEMMAEKKQRGRCADD